MKKCGFFIVICEKASYNRDNVHSLTVLSKCFISMIVKGEGGEVDPRYRVDIIWYCDRSVRSVRGYLLIVGARKQPREDVWRERGAPSFSILTRSISKVS